MKKGKYPQGSLPIKVDRKDFNRYVDPYLSHCRRGPRPKLSRCKIFNYILYVLHTGIQWNQLKTNRNELHWSNVYKWHLKWSKDGSYENLFKTSVRELFGKYPIFRTHSLDTELEVDKVMCTKLDDSESCLSLF